MFINGCKIVCVLCGENPEGFSSTVSRELTTTNSDGSVSVEVVSRGPFKTILEAQKYAHAWKDAASPPAIEPAAIESHSTESLNQ